MKAELRQERDSRQAPVWDVLTDKSQKGILGLDAKTIDAEVTKAKFSGKATGLGATVKNIIDDKMLTSAVGRDIGAFRLKGLNKAGAVMETRAATDPITNLLTSGKLTDLWKKINDLSKKKDMCPWCKGRVGACLLQSTIEGCFRGCLLWWW